MAERLVNLEMVTTAVSQQMCYSIPFRGGHGAFYYDPAEWATLFPARVMGWLERVAAAQGEPFRLASGVELRKLPGERPLAGGGRRAHEPELSRPPLRGASLCASTTATSQTPDRGMKRVWFSDGGISSNLPLHFFDAPLPGRPTFAVNLKGQHPAHPVARTGACAPKNGRVYLPTRNSAGLIRYWYAPPSGDAPGPREVLLGHHLHHAELARRDPVSPTRVPRPHRPDQPASGRRGTEPQDAPGDHRRPERSRRVCGTEARAALSSRLGRSRERGLGESRGGPRPHLPARGRGDDHPSARGRSALGRGGGAVPREGPVHPGRGEPGARNAEGPARAGGRIEASRASLETDAPKPQPTLRSPAICAAASRQGPGAIRSSGRRAGPAGGIGHGAPRPGPRSPPSGSRPRAVAP